MSKIPTAEDLATQMQHNLGYNDLIDPIKFASLVAIEYTKLHVQAALKAASDWVGEKEGVDFNLKNSYPLDNIK